MNGLTFSFITITYYELKIYKNFHCLDENFLNEKIKFSKDDFLINLNDNLNNIIRFGYFYQTFILSIVMCQTQNDTIEINNQEIEILKNSNKQSKFGKISVCGTHPISIRLARVDSLRWAELIYVSLMLAGPLVL